jgi:hypothetical protein
VTRKQKQIAGLLAEAQSSLASGDYVRPTGASAADRYRAVLQIQSQQPEAVTGLQQVADALIVQVERARKVEDTDTALALLADARSVQPDHPRIARLQADLDERKLKLQRRAAANLQDAGEHIARARVYLDRTPIKLRNVAEANDHYDEAVETAPSAPDLNALRERILAGYASAAQAELAANEPARALKVLMYARKRKMSSAPLDQLEPQIQALVPAR